MILIDKNTGYEINSSSKNQFLFKQIHSSYGPNNMLGASMYLKHTYYSIIQQDIGHNRNIEKVEKKCLAETGTQSMVSACNIITILNFFLYSNEKFKLQLYKNKTLSNVQKLEMGVFKNEQVLFKLCLYNTLILKNIGFQTMYEIKTKVAIELYIK